MNNHPINHYSLPSDVRDALEHIVDHFWSIAESQYRTREPGDRSGHVFRSLTTVQKWLKALSGQKVDNQIIPSIRGEGWSL